jgi:hypothetical protein
MIKCHPVKVEDFIRDLSQEIRIYQKISQMLVKDPPDGRQVPDNSCGISGMTGMVFSF